MPTYAYRCESCGHEFEEFQSIKAEPIKVCPECKRAKVRRLIGTGAAVLFKGSGFYQTDYRSSSYTTAAKAETGSSSSSSSSESASGGTSGSSNGKASGSNGSSNGSSGAKGAAGTNGSGK